MGVEFKKITDYKRGTIAELLTDAYAYNEKNYEVWGEQWKEFDNFFYDNPEIADKYGFYTVLDGEVIGMISWDPRNMPKYVEVGHNCIRSSYKGNGYGKLQLKEAIRRILEYDNEKIIVSTNASFIPAMHNYQSAGFMETGRRKNIGKSEYAGDYIDYEYRGR